MMVLMIVLIIMMMMILMMMMVKMMTTMVMMMMTLRGDGDTGITRTVHALFADSCRNPERGLSLHRADKFYTKENFMPCMTFMPFRKTYLNVS